jgi:anhydro-N-acetylmuramic acid kinase
MNRNHDPLELVRTWRDRADHLVIGLMTGTSVDAVDTALVKFEGHGLDSRHTLVAYRETPLEPALRREVLEVASADEMAPERLMRLDAALGERYAAAVLELLAAERVDPASVHAVGSHGQTVRHVPRDAGEGQALTLQLGSAAVLAERTGLTVVSDFRTRDTAAGGEGAPLVPIADWWMFRSDTEARVLLNLGGMANVTHLPRGAQLEDVVAFDTGPGNAVLDALVALRSEGAETHDHGGELALRGKPNLALLSELLGDPFFETPPPRSTGRERFGEQYANKLRDVCLTLGVFGEDILATGVELTAASVADAIHRFLVPRGGVDVVYASGGGVRNAALMRSLERRLGDIPIKPLGALGVQPESKEAVAFALLAHLTLGGVPGNVPGATGALHPAVLGHITPGAMR